jgi:hypothetical protein
MPYKDPEAHKEYRIRRSQANLKFLREYKVAKGCADCGWNKHHAGLEFDHLSDKFKNMGEMVRYKTARMMEELSKCEVVCGTCHNLRTWQRKVDNGTATMV